MTKRVIPSQKARAIIDAISYITVATTDKNGDPWNTPVAGYHFNNDYTFYWASWAENQHSKNIRLNGKAFIVIYDSTPSDGPTEGVYILASATELTDEDEVMRAALVFGDDPHNPSDGGQYLEGYPRRIYRAVPQKVWLNEGSEINDYFIDIRLVAEE